MQTLPKPLQPLAEYAQFILWKLAQRAGKPVKLPVSPLTGEVVDAHDTAHHVTAAQAIEVAALFGYGVGFVFTEADPFFFVDLDKCLQPDGQSWSPIAMNIMARLSGAAVEVSQSGTGLHIFGKGTVPPHGCKNIQLGLEFYTSGRFVALTGTGAIGSADTDHSAALPDLVDIYFPLKGDSADPIDWSDAPVPEWNGPEDDDELLAKALKSKSKAAMFGHGVSFKALWEADVDILAAAYPAEDPTRPYDGSSADAAIAQHLAFWTGKNCDRIQRLMERSALVREKWEREDYLPRTILQAVGKQRDVYQQVRPSAVDEVAPPVERKGSVSAELITGYQYLSADMQLEYFRGCVYVQDAHRVLIPGGSMLKPEQFNATYGGYSFQVDDTGKTTKKAWEAFTESQVARFPKAETTCFCPELPPSEVVESEGRLLVNLYSPVVTRRVKGDVTPFLTHLAKVLPDEGDQRILLSYMAACVQHKGIKFQWAPLLQGAEGNGKTLFTRCVAFAIGERYTHLPPANELAEKFNAWLFDKLFIGIEDVYVPEHKKEVIEVLKPMITNDRLARRAMQQDQSMHNVCANFMLNSNHKDAIRKTRTDRRFAVFYTAQQNEEDIEAAGMNGDYFPKLYAWLRADGYAIVNEYLQTYAIPEDLNPATNCHRAPRTSSTDEVLRTGMGGVEQSVMEAVAEGRVGFAGGWISSVALDNLLKDVGAHRAIAPNKRRDMLKDLGYDWHPALTDGRTNNSVQIDGGKKPRLFIHRDSPYQGITSAAMAVKTYVAIQEGAEPPTMAERVFGGEA
jgi:hypothetical protein